MRTFICLVIMIILTGCSSMSKQSSRGYVHEPGKDVKEEMLRSCWYCGDYTGPVTGTTTLTSPQRICSPTWNSCPSLTTLGDGSTWQFSANCKCNG